MFQEEWFVLLVSFAYTTSCQKCCAETSSRQISHMSCGSQLTTHLSSLATFYSIWCSFPLEHQGYEIRLTLQANGCSSRKRDRQAAHPRCWRLSTRMHLSYSCWFVLRTRYLVYSAPDICIKANVTTGLINLNIQTMFVGDVKAMGILCMYAMGVCACAWLCRKGRVWKM